MAKIIRYSERKISQQQARCLDCGNLPLDVDYLNEISKIALMKNRALLNRAVRLNSIHITLNFHPSEHRLNDARMSKIAHLYMHLLGFGEQPYIVYRHLDTAHPHMHLISTPIRSDGTRIRMHRIGTRRSQPAQRRIEKEFNLLSTSPEHTGKALTSKKQTAPHYSIKGHIEQHTEALINNHNLTNFDQWNALLFRQGIRAFRRQPNDPESETLGLSYALINEKGRSITTGIPASHLATQPTMSRLGELFEKNKRRAHHANHQQRVPSSQHEASRKQTESHIDPDSLQEALMADQNLPIYNTPDERHPRQKSTRMDQTSVRLKRRLS